LAQPILPIVRIPAFDPAGDGVTTENLCRSWTTFKQMPPVGVFPATKGADMASSLPNQLLRRSFVKTVLRRLIATITVVGLIYGLIAVVYATKTIFKVKMNYAVVLERFGGVRQAVTDVGWHARLPYFTRIEQEVPLMNQTLQLGGTPAPMRIISKGNVALWTSGVLTYRIRDLNTWAIENLSPLDLLQGDYDGIVKDILQAQQVDRLISDRESIKEVIFTALKSRPINIGGPTIEEEIRC
jgi:hypothetical protein